MKEKRIRFFSPADNSKPSAAKTEKEKPVTLTGTISAFGKLVFSMETVEKLGIQSDTAYFKIGTQEGKRKLKSLFLVPTTDATDAFILQKGGKSYGLPLAGILQKYGIDFKGSKFDFTIKPFEFQEGVTGYELQLEDQAPKPEYTGKPRGRKPKNKAID